MVREPWTVDAGAHAVPDASIMSGAAGAMIDPATAVAEAPGIARKSRPIGSDRANPRNDDKFRGDDFNATFPVVLKSSRRAGSGYPHSIAGARGLCASGLALRPR